MKSEQINIILLGIIIFLLMKKDKKEQKTFVMNGQGKAIGDLGTTF